MSIEQDKRDAVILANVRRIIKKTRQHNWILAMETFGFGSTMAWAMCARLGLDPESRTTSMSTMFDHIERAHAPIETKLPDPLYLALGITGGAFA